MKIFFEKVRFLTSALAPTEWPIVKTPQGKLTPEIALVGRSNVGKSSLINALLRQKIAKASATPGKTQRINFFLVDESLLLVDLPGYGYAKAPSETAREWSESIDRYFSERTSFSLILLLIDARRGPRDDEMKIASWAQQRSIPLLTILTKTDKLNFSELDAAMEKAKLLLGECFPFNIHDKEARRKLIAAIQKRVI